MQIKQTIQVKYESDSVECIFNDRSFKFHFDAPQEAKDIFAELSKSVQIEQVDLPRAEAFFKFIDFFVDLSNPCIIAKKLKAIDQDDLETDSSSLLLLYQRHVFLEISSYFDNMFINWNSLMKKSEKYSIGSTSTKILEIQSFLDLVLDGLSKGKDSHFRILGGELRSEQVNSVLLRVVGNVNSYISNKRDIWKLFNSHILRQENPLAWEFQDPHPDIIQGFLEAQHVTLYFLNADKMELNTPLKRNDKKIDLKQFAIPSNGRQKLVLSAIEFDYSKSIKKKFEIAPYVYELASQKTCSPLINSSELVYHGGEVCFSKTPDGIVCTIPIAQHVNKLSLDPMDGSNQRQTFLHQPYGNSQSGKETCDDSTDDSMDEDIVKDFNPETNKKSRKRAHIMKRMEKLGFQPWSFVEGRDPIVLKNNSSLGSVYVLRSKVKQDPDWKDIFKDTLFNDPGLNFFKVYFNAGTGDYFIAMPSISNDLRHIANKISTFQKELDEKLNQDEELRELERQKDLAKLERLTKDHSTIEKKKTLLENSEKAAKAYWDERSNRSKQDPLSQDISRLHKVSKGLVKKLHTVCKQFETAFSTLVQPDFKADQNLLKKKPNELGKSWKRTASSMSHAKLSNAVRRKQALIGQCFVTCSEACSTLGCGFCTHPNTPGRKKIHACNRKDCKKIGIRDFSGSVIARMTLEQCLMLARKSSDAKVRETEFPIGCSSKVSQDHS
jgi:hypothetical protein